MQLKSDRKEQLAPYQFYQDEVISVPGAQGIISVLASARVSGVTAMTDELRVSYRLCYKVLFKGESDIDCVEETAEKQTVIRQVGVTPQSAAGVEASVISTEYVGTTSLKVRLSIEMTGYFLRTSSWEVADPDAQLQVRTMPVDVEHILPVGEKEIVAEREFEVKEGLGRVLTYDTQVLIKRVRAGAEIAEVEGECYTYLTYVNDASLLSRTLLTPFHAEVLVEGMSKDSPIYLHARPNATTITQPDGVGSTSVRLEIVVGLSGYAIDRVSQDVIVDAYSTQKEVKCEKAEIALDASLCLMGVSDRLSGSVRLDEQAPRVRSVLCVCPPAVGSVSVSREGEVCVEGVIACDVIYLTDREGVARTLAQIPYRVLVTEPFACDGMLSASVSAYNLTARARHNDEIEVSGELQIELFGSSDVTLQVLQHIEPGEDKEENDAAITLYLVHPGETLWDVAKALSTREDTLLALNPDLTLPLTGGERVLLYRPV